jgi:hypothetical protein
MMVGLRRAEGGVVEERWEGAKSKASPIEAAAKSCALSSGDGSPDGDPSLPTLTVSKGLRVSREGDSSSKRE